MKKVNGIFLQNELLYALEADLLLHCMFEIIIQGAPFEIS